MEYRAPPRASEDDIADVLLTIAQVAGPEASKALLKRSQDWLLSHALQLMATIAFLLGAYLAISGLVRLT